MVTDAGGFNPGYPPQCHPPRGNKAVFLGIVNHQKKPLGKWPYFLGDIQPLDSHDLKKLCEKKTTAKILFAIRMRFVFRSINVSTTPRLAAATATRLRSDNMIGTLLQLNMQLVDQTLEPDGCCSLL